MKRLFLLAAITALMVFGTQTESQAARTTTVTTASASNSKNVITQVRYRRIRPQRRGFFSRMMDMERRKNAWLRDAFGF